VTTRPGLTLAVSEAPVIEEKDGEAGGGETLGEGLEPETRLAGETVGHEDDRWFAHGIWKVQPGGAFRVLGMEGDIMAGPRPGRWGCWRHR